MNKKIRPSSPLYKWLKTQPKEFVENVLNNKLLGDGEFQLKDLIELDRRFNPEDEND